MVNFIERPPPNDRFVETKCELSARAAHWTHGANSFAEGSPQLYPPGADCWSIRALKSPGISPGV